MSLQSVFDTVAAHLLSQGRRSWRGDKATGVGMCRLRADDGARCAVGCLLPDEVYDESLEGRTIDTIMHTAEWQRGSSGPYSCAAMPARRAWDHLAGLAPEAADGQLGSLLGELQAVHDKMDPARWLETLMSVAWRHGLSTGRLRAVVDLS